MTIDLNTFVFVITTIFGAYIVYKFMGIFFDRSEINKKVELLTYLIYSFIITTVYLALNIPILTLMINMILFFILTFNYKASIKNRVVAVSFICLILVAVESIVVLLSGYIQNSLYTMNPINFPSIGIIVAKVASYIVVLVIENLKNKQRDIEIPTIHWISIFIMPFGSLYIILNLMGGLNLSVYSISLSIGILFGINIIGFYLYDKLSQLYEEKVEKAMLKEQNKYYKAQLNILEDTNENAKAICQDMKNHISLVRGYIQIEDYEKAINYLDQISKEVYGEKEISKSGNMDIDSILNYKLNEAIKKDISVSIESKLPSDMSILSLDIAVVLGNLLDNAIEVTSKANGDKKIDIKIRYQNKILFINIQNTFDNAVVYDEGMKSNSKNKKANHRIGLKNIEEILEKYNGLMNIHHKDNRFTTDIIMYIS